eukprot:492431_1
MHVSSLFVLIISISILLCAADRDDCDYWKCDGYKSTTEFDEYKNCSLNSTLWRKGELYECKYCLIADGGECWCATKGDCEETSLLLFGIAMMVLSTLCVAIVWYQYLKKRRELNKFKELLVQQEKRRKKRNNKRKKRRRNHSRSKSPSPFLYSKTNTSYEDIGEDDDDQSRSSIEDIHSISSIIDENIITIQDEIDQIDKYNIKCICVWGVTVICILAFF